MREDHQREKTGASSAPDAAPAVRAEAHAPGRPQRGFVIRRAYTARPSSESASAAQQEAPPAGLRVGIGYLFATGPNPARDRIFHVGGVRFSEQSPPEARDWILDPGRHLTKRLVTRSNVSNPRCQGKPSWGDVGPAAITPFFAGLDVLFVFDLDHQEAWFRKRVLAKVASPPVCIDLHAMAQFFLPDQPAFDLETLLNHAVSEQAWKRSAPRLPDLVRSLGVVLHDILSTLFARPGGAYRPHLIYAALERAVRAPGAPEDFQALLRVAAHAHRLRWRDDLFAKPYEAPQPLPLDGLGARQLAQELQCFLPPTAPSESLPTEHDASGNSRPPKLVRPADVEQAFDKLQQDFPSFTPRPSQQTFGRFCAEAVNQGGVYAVEAGTGTGKTLGYLVPACSFVHRNPGRQVVIVTATKNLQNQILEQELPRLTGGKSLYHGLRGAVLKGKANYLCVTALADLFEELFGPDSDAAGRLAWLYLCLRLLRTGGELEGIPWGLQRRLPLLAELREEVNAQIACVPGLCRLGMACVYPRRLKQARAADIVVTNQHKLAFTGSLLNDRAAVCFIDEADQFPENFRSALQVELADARVRRRYLYRLSGTRKRRGFTQILQERIEKDQAFAEQDEDFEALEECLRSIEAILASCSAVDEQLQAIGRIPHVRYDGDYRWSMLRPHDAGEQLQQHLGLLAHHFDRIALQWEAILRSGRYRLLEQGTEDTRKRRFLKAERARIEKYRTLTVELKTQAEALAADFPSRDFVHVYRRRRGSWALAKIPFDLAAPLQAVLLEPFSTVLFTSATLFVDGTLELFARELGLAQPFDAALRLASPFDYEQNVFAAVATFLRPFRWKDPPAVKKTWLHEVAGTIAALAVATYGRTLVLLTNTHEMQEIFRLVRPVLERHDIEPLVQTGSSLAEINAFRATEHSVLFGVDRLWAGVDFPGPTLSQVIVVRLPNPSLADPLIQHRRECQGQDFWKAYYRPVTQLKLKQGFGRLIRSEKDRGLFVVLDPRLVEDERMRSLQAALPVRLKSFTHAGPDSALVEMAVQGLKTLGLHREFVERGIDLHAL